MDSDLKISTRFAILHSSKHSYIYTFGQFGHYGNNCTPWPFEDETLWPWTRSREPTPHLGRDVWNIIFGKLSPCDILNLGKVCRILRVYAHDDRAWISRFEHPWKFYRNLNACTDLRRDRRAMNFFLNACVPFSRAKTVVIKTAFEESYLIPTEKGNFGIRRSRGKKNFTFFWGSTFTSRFSCSLNDMILQIMRFLTDGKVLREYWLTESPVRFVRQFIELSLRYPLNADPPVK